MCEERWLQDIYYFLSAVSSLSLLLFFLYVFHHRLVSIFLISALFLYFSWLREPWLLQRLLSKRVSSGESLCWVLKEERHVTFIKPSHGAEHQSKSGNLALMSLSWGHARLWASEITSNPTTVQKKTAFGFVRSLNSAKKVNLWRLHSINQISLHYAILQHSVCRTSALVHSWSNVYEWKGMEQFFFFVCLFSWVFSLLNSSCKCHDMVWNVMSPVLFKCNWETFCPFY